MSIPPSGRPRLGGGPARSRLTPEPAVASGPGHRVVGGFLRASSGVLMLLLAWGCADDPPTPSETARVDPVAEEELPAERARIYERVLAFTTLEGGAPATGPVPSLAVAPEDAGAPAGGEQGAPEDVEPPADTMLVVPLLFRAWSTPDGVRRRIRGWVGRGSTWESFAEQEWQAPPSRTPWRIVPRGPVRLVVGDGGAVETVIFRDPPRVLELDLGEELVEWTGAEGSTFRLESTSVLLGSRSFEGITLDMARGQALADGPPGDWAFLVSGDSLQVVLESPTEAAPGTVSAFRAFGRLDFRRLQWPEVTVEWSESRAYEPARRDVPAAWQVTSTGPGVPRISGSFSSRSAQLTAGDGDGPVLPVDALFIVSGAIVLEGSEYPVQGLYRHRRE